MKRTQGFTIVEIAVVIVILTVLTTLTLLGYNRTMSNSRNDAANSKSKTIVAALEKYYSQNGEYPTCAQLTGASVATYLPSIELTMLTRDGSGAAAGTNSISCGSATVTNFAYTSTASTYTLSYIEEVTGTTVTFTRQHN